MAFPAILSLIMNAFYRKVRLYKDNTIKHVYNTIIYASLLYVVPFQAMEDSFYINKVTIGYVMELAIMPEYVSYMLALGVAYDADIALTTHMFGSFDNKQMDADDVRIWTGEDAVEAILCYKVPIGCYCKMFKRKILNTTRFIPEVFIGEGFNFNVAAFQKSNRILAGKLKTYFYRRDNPTSAMTKFSIKKCECGLKALDIIKENLQIHTDRVQTAWEFADWRTHSDFYDAMALAKVKNEYPEFYRKCLNVTKQRALVALKVPTTKSNKIRAILMRVCPATIPFMLKIREKRHNVNITHR